MCTGFPTLCMCERVNHVLRQQQENAFSWLCMFAINDAWPTSNNKIGETKFSLKKVCIYIIL